MKRYIPVLLLVIIVLAALFVRKNTFWINHWQGDQCYYLSLAMKLEKYGLAGYNLRGVNVGVIDIVPEGNVRLLFPKPTDNGGKGLILSALIRTGNVHYDIPLFLNAPGFPLALIISNKLFAQEGQPYTALFSNVNRILIEKKPYLIFRAQFFAVIVPLFFSLMTIVTVFLLGKLIFSETVGLCAAFLYSIHPISVFTSQKIWADDMLTFFIASSVLVYLISFGKSKYLLALLAGILCGFAVLSKQTAIFLVPAIWTYTLFIKLKNKRDFRTIFSAIFNVRFLLFVLGLTAVTWFWFYEVYRVYGSPFYVPPRDLKAIAEKDTLGWYMVVFNRPHTYILFGIGIPYLCPLFGFAYASFIRFVREVKKFIVRMDPDYEFIILWLWILVFYLTSFKVGKEYRYMLPVLPPLAILAAVYIDKFRQAIRARTNAGISVTVILLLFVACCFWSLPIGQSAVINNETLILRPF